MLKSPLLLRIFFFNILLLFFCFRGYSQQWSLMPMAAGDFSIYAGIGASKLHGDLGGYNIEKVLWSEYHPSFSLGARYTSPVRVGFSLYLSKNSYSGDDIDTHNADRTRPPMSYTASEWDINFQVEYTLFGADYYLTGNPHWLYAFSGSGVAFVNSRVLNYRPTDQVKTQVNAPFVSSGIGYRYRISELWGIEAQFKGTYFFSDQIDGIHIPIWSKNNDYSNEFKITVSYHIPEWTGVRRCNCDRLH